MDKEKEIEEMRIAIEDLIELDGWAEKGDVKFIETSKNLYEAGYGNVAQAVKEFAEMLKKRYPPMSFGYQSFDICNDIDNLIKELYPDESEHEKETQ